MLPKQLPISMVIKKDLQPQSAGDGLDLVAVHCWKDHGLTSFQRKTDYRAPAKGPPFHTTPLRSSQRSCPLGTP